MNSVATNECCPEKRVWVLDLMEDNARVRVNRDVEFSKHTYKLGETIAALVQTLAEDVCVNLFDLSEVGAAIENRNEP